MSSQSAALVRTVSGPRYRLDQPALIVAFGNDMWVGNNTLTEENGATGALISVV